MGLSQLSKACQKCKYKDKCNNKRMEALAYYQPLISPAIISVSAPMVQPLLQPHDYRDIKIDRDTTVTIDLEDIKRELLESHMPRLFEYGA